MTPTATILLIDDDVHVRQALGEVLAAENYDVSMAADGEEAIRQLQEKGARPVDAIVMDLPLGPENGWNVFRRLTTIDPLLPVIIITSRRDQNVPAFAPQCVALMQKPLDLLWLCQTLRSVMAEREPPVQHSTDSQCSEKQLGPTTDRPGIPFKV